MDHLYVQTPIIESTLLSKKIGIPVYLKMEAVQPTGSYKARGLGVLVSDYVARGKHSFVTASTGNAALSLAYACRILKSSLKVVLPLKTPTFMQDKIALEGADVIIQGKNFEDSKRHAKEIAAKEKITFIDPHDNPMIFEGISTMIYEIFGAGLKPEAILLPVGCGDLLVGVMQGLNACKWDDIAIITAEREQHCPFATALFAEEDHAETILRQVFTKIKNHKIYPQIVTDKAALHAAKEFANDQRILIETESAAALALVYESLPILKTFSSILVIVTGGANINLEQYLT